jgi:SPP1 gp7 family putative phage head morphogenesis protein
MAVNESAVVRAIRGFKAALAANEADEIRELATHYLDVERALEANISALSEQVNALYAAGEDPTWSQLYRLERFQRLEAQLVAELARFNGWAAELIKQHQWQLGLKAIDDAAAVMELAKPGYAASVRLPTDAVEAMAGTARNGAPLGDLLAASYSEARQAIVKELIRSVALGRNPKVTAAAIRKATGIPLDRALTIARTEQMRAYNASSLSAYRAMGVTQYQRLADYGERTCIACLAASGQVLSSEAELSDHPRGRCTCVPLIPGVDNPEVPSSEAWFNAQPESVRRAIAGPGRYEAYNSGQVKWSDLATHTHDPVWGGSLSPTPVSAL